MHRTYTGRSEKNRPFTSGNTKRTNRLGLLIHDLLKRSDCMMSTEISFVYSNHKAQSFSDHFAYVLEDKPLFAKTVNLIYFIIPVFSLLIFSYDELDMEMIILIIKRCMVSNTLKHCFA